MTLGTELGISVGPLGRTAGSDLRAGKGGVAAAFAYAHSRGLFVGVSIEAGVVVARPDVNEAYYGSPVSVRDLLSGVVRSYVPTKLIPSVGTEWQCSLLNPVPLLGL